MLTEQLKPIHRAEIIRRLTISNNHTIETFYTALAAGGFLTSGGIKLLTNNNASTDFFGGISALGGISLLGFIFWLMRYAAKNGWRDQTPTHIEAMGFLGIAAICPFVPHLYAILLIVGAAFVIPRNHVRRLRKAKRSLYFREARIYLKELKALQAPFNQLPR
ncbi:MAG: hypothetical protein EG825_08600 [Rhodocyclaceae bacterium]|nr:hypothetical protein [Rhodocyclaceae bacterium]